MKDFENKNVQEVSSKFLIKEHLFANSISILNKHILISNIHHSEIQLNLHFNLFMKCFFS